VITVTYGQRWGLLKPVLLTLSQHHPAISNIIVVDNASRDNIPERCKELGDPRITLIQLARNSGSAGGFAAGLATARGSGAEFFWLLDDDNLPEPGCLERLLLAWELLGSEPRNVMLALRPDRREYVRAVREGLSPGIKSNSFLGFHVADVPQKILKKLRQRRTSATNANTSVPFMCPLISVGYAPYGGLLLHRVWVEKVGLPNERYFTYSDDHEYASRILRAGGKIYLCATAVLRDLEPSWHIKLTGPYHPFMDPRADEGRLYYTIRNRVNLEVTNYISSPFLYRVNMFFKLGWLALGGLLAFRSPAALLQRMQLLRRAVLDGLYGRLGEAKVWTDR
jgi:GT2 family glycosyltransferase